MKTFLKFLTILVFGAMMAGCAGRHYIGPPKPPERGKITGVYVTSSADKYYNDLDARSRPYFEEIEKALAQKGWIAVNMNEEEQEGHPLDTGRVLKRADAAKLKYLIFFSYKFKSAAEKMPCRRVIIKAKMYNVPIRKALFYEEQQAKDIIIYDKYPAAAQGHYPDDRRNTTRYYGIREGMTWDDICREALEKIMPSLPR
jgi:hypothetical protein